MFQELKCAPQEFPEEFKFDGYHTYLNLAKGSPGVAILSKEKPIQVTMDLPSDQFKNEKRLITAEYKDFFLVATYVINAGRDLKTLDKRMEWNKVFDKYIQSLDKKKPIIVSGDLNVAHEEIGKKKFIFFYKLKINLTILLFTDLANPATNHKHAGFTPQEREGFTKLLSLGFDDTFRHFYPDQKGAYTFWSYMGQSRKKNVGWRLDYFLSSKRFTKYVKDVVHRDQVLGSDHCPIVLFLEI
jgi:AP endonuclease-1